MSKRLSQNTLFLPRFTLAIALALLATISAAVAKEAPDYNKQIAPLLNKYCAGCHNAEDREGDFSLETFAQLQEGGENGVVLSPGSAASSRLIGVLTGSLEPSMPPEDNEAPTEEEIQLLQDWVDAGAPGPDGAEPDRTKLHTPHIEPGKNAARAVTTMAWSPTDDLIAVGRFQEVVLQKAASLRNASQENASRETVRKLGPHPGKVNDIRFSSDGKQIVTATGIVGLYGKAMLFNTADGKLLREFQGHRDTVYAVALSPNGKVLATGGYDRKIILWDVATGKQLRTLSGHNGAIYDLAFHPGGDLLASASGDDTVKLWQVSTGARLDTLSQPLSEQYAVAFSPDGRFVAAAGVDHRIRVWRIVSLTKAKINPLVYARFAHEAPIIQLQYTSDGAALVSSAEDKTLKLWNTNGYLQDTDYERQPDIAAALALSPKGDRLLVGRLNGEIQEYPLRLQKQAAANTHAAGEVAASRGSVVALETVDEIEPNNTAETATVLKGPAKIKGLIHSAGGTSGLDQDLYRFHSLAGSEWVMEIKAARDKSPLDSYIEVLDAQGKPIQRVLLQAVRDSYFTFRGKDSNTSNDFRVQNWREMELNEYLYSAGEVVKLWLYPRGPDSGFKVYPGEGNRYGFFDTTPLSHALNEPCYIVEPHAPGAELIPNGLPVFPVYYENDDESHRRFGADSKLAFTAPAEGDYLLRVSDVRGLQGADFKYELTIRPRRADFTVSLGGANPNVNAGSAREFSVRANRLDNFEGEIRVEISGLPPGFSVTSPLVIQAGHNVAYGVLSAAADAPKPTAENAKNSKVTATAAIDGEAVTHDVNNLGEIKLSGPPKLRVRLLAAAGGKEDAAGKEDEAKEAAPLELVIAPGETIMARVRVERLDFKNRVSFGNDDAGRNLPHGVYVDNIGLNGLMIVKGQTERTFYLTAASWTPETTRLFHLRATDDGGQASAPVILHVRKRKLANTEK